MYRKILIISLGFLFTFLISFADAITLPNGKSVEGVIVEETDEYIKVETQGVPLTYYKNISDQNNNAILTLEDDGCPSGGIRSFKGRMAYRRCHCQLEYPKLRDLEEEFGVNVIGAHKKGTLKEELGEKYYYCAIELEWIEDRIPEYFTECTMQVDKVNERAKQLLKGNQRKPSIVDSEMIRDCRLLPDKESSSDFLRYEKPLRDKAYSPEETVKAYLTERKNAINDEQRKEIEFKYKPRIFRRRSRGVATVIMYKDEKALAAHKNKTFYDGKSVELTEKEATENGLELSFRHKDGYVHFYANLINEDGVWKIESFGRVSLKAKGGKSCGSQKIDSKSGRWALRFMAFSGAFIALSFVLVVAIFVISWLPKRIRICPVEQFKNAQQITIFYSETQKICLLKDSSDFHAIINSLTDEQREEDYDTYVMSIQIQIKNKAYNLEISPIGWNFKGERRNCRRVKDGIALMSLMNSLYDTQQQNN
ncbi:MAG: hypothetical protein GY858_01220 [Candidatus Omnitrophica bacterium]|nr:hypothetical protein [Candidatus Omnitrophota bacterium]